MVLSYLANILHLIVKQQKIYKFIIKEMFMASSLFKTIQFLNGKVIYMYWLSIHSFLYFLNPYCMISSAVCLRQIMINSPKRSMTILILSSGNRQSIKISERLLLVISSMKKNIMKSKGRIGEINFYVQSQESTMKKSHLVCYVNNENEP